MKQSNKPYSVIPPEELRCCWMTAGILSYQLCDRSFDCDKCPLDAAMRKNFSKQTSKGKQEIAFQPQPAQPGILPQDLQYSINHCWLQKKHDGVVRVGIEPALVGMLLIPKAIVLPSIGQQVQQGEICVWIVMNEGTFPLASPLSGEVIARNTSVTDEPRLMTLHPLREGWLYHLRVTTEALNAAHLMKDSEAADHYAGDTTRLNDALMVEACNTPPSVGVTLADGGQPLQAIADLIGPKKYFTIIRKLFS